MEAVASMKRIRTHGPFESTQTLTLHQFARECVLAAWAIGMNKEISSGEGAELVATMLSDLDAEASVKRRRKK